MKMKTKTMKKNRKKNVNLITKPTKFNGEGNMRAGNVLRVGYVSQKYKNIKKFQDSIFVLKFPIYI